MTQTIILKPAQLRDWLQMWKKGLKTCRHILEVMERRLFIKFEGTITDEFERTKDTFTIKC